ncbi:MAG: glycosyltransferase family 4 protein [Halobacteriovoraceae bacterium]|nr:glycosyltransferase family 4 protein [Halobacteriovoraceae bacterium]
MRSDIGGGPRHVSEILKYGTSRISYYVAAPSDHYYSLSFLEDSKGYLSIPHRKFNLRTLFKIINFCHKHKIRIIHSHGFGAGIYTKFLGLLGFRVFHTFHGFHLKSDLTSRFKTWLEKALSSTYEKQISVSRSEQKNCQLAGILSHVIENGIANDLITDPNRDSPLELRKIGIISRFDPQKNLLWFLDRVPNILKKYPGIKILIAGDGEQKEELLKKTKILNIQNDVKFLGFQKPLEFFKNIDLLVFPSLGEGLPYTVLEAMAQGIPLIASRVQGHIDLISEDFLFDLSDEKEFLNLLENPCRNHQPFIKTNFMLEEKVKEIERLYL